MVISMFLCLILGQIFPTKSKTTTMKKLKMFFASTLVMCLMFIANSANAQCVIVPQDSSGLDPNWTDLPCIVQGQAYSEVINLKNFGSVSGITVEWLRVDSITNAPAGISWAMNVPSGNQPNTLLTNEDGCIAVTGTTNEPRGDYQLGLYVCVKITLSPNPLCGEANALIQQIGGIVPGASLPDFSYFLRVIESGETCPDSLVSNIRELSSVTSLNVFPNPISNKAVVTFNSTESTKLIARIMDIVGKEVYSENVTVVPGTNRVEIAKGNIAPGVYLFTLSDGKSTATKRVIFE